MTRLKKLLALFAVYVVYVAGVEGLSIYLEVPASGTIKDYELTGTPDTVHFGLFAVGESVTRTQEITNTGTDTVTNLNLTLKDVVGITDFDLTWNLEGTSLAPLESATATYNLTVYAYADPNFFLTLVLSGEP